jgi:hypothetical protein
LPDRTRLSAPLACILDLGTSEGPTMKAAAEHVFGK